MSALDRRRNMAGFTLVEMAIVLLISGMLMTMVAAFTRNYYSKLQEERTLENIRLAESAIVVFVGNTGRYPCPADPTLPPTDVNYGREQCRTLPLPIDCSSGVPAGLKCTNVSSRDSDGDGRPEVVMIGMVPVKTIYGAVVEDVNFREKHGLDGYGNRLTYAVTEIMTSTANNSFNPINYDLGAIRVDDARYTRLTSPASTAHFVLVSHGENGEGAYSQQGTEIPGCTVVIAGVPSPAPEGEYGGVNPEKENCDRNDAIFVDDVKSLNWSGNSYFDDIVVFRSGGFQPLWVQSLGSDPGRVWINNTNLGNVAVGPGLHDAKQRLHVLGDLSAQGATLAQGYCGTTGPGGASTDDDCMSAKTIAGDEADMRCPNSTDAVYGIEDNKVLCRPLFLSPPPPGNVCAPGEYLVGISNKGNIRCAPL